MIDILVLNYNDSSTTVQFVERLESLPCARRILVVDNHSTDDSLKKLSSLQNDKIIVVQTKKNGGYGAGNNWGVRYLHEHFKSDYILLSNPDVIVTNEVCEQLEIFLRNNQDYALAAPFMLNAQKERQYNTAFRIPSKWEYILSIDLFLSKLTGSFYYKDIKEERKTIKNVGSVTGSMFLMRTKDMLDYGMYDENIFLYCEELVLGIKMRNAHKKIALLTDCSFIHNHSVSISKTYKSAVSKHKLFMKSKLYAIKHYYQTNFIEYSIAWLLSKISTVEIFLNSLLRGRK